MLSFLTKPVPHDEAVKLIADKPAVAKDVFDQLPDELKGRAFTITGIEDFDVAQGVRDEIAKLPAGADWDVVKKEIMARISPWFTPEGAEARAKLLMSHHAFAAYSACQARIMDEMADVFPYRQYLSTNDGKVRASHRALHGIILPSNHPFWQKHTPPWEWNCRCQVVELTEEDRDEEYARDQKRAPENRRVLEGASLNQLQHGSLNRGLSINVDVRTPKERGGTYEWSARDATLPYDEIRKRWDDATASEFETWARGQHVTPGRSLYGWLTGAPAIPLPAVPAVIPAVPAVPKAIPQGNAVEVSTFADAVKAKKLDEKERWTRRDIANLRAALKVADPAKESDLIEKIEGTRKTGALTEREVRRAVQNLLNMVPRGMADGLPKVKIRIVDTSLGGSATGDFNFSTNVVRVTTQSMKNLKGEVRRRELFRVLSHELMHWVHMNAKGPAGDAYRKAIKDHFDARTAGEITLGGYRADKWYDLYAGRVYNFPGGDVGIEVPTRYHELWQTPDRMIELLDPAASPDAAAHRETLALVHAFFDLNPIP